MTGRPRFGVRFWFPWAVDAIVACVALYFFAAGLADGSVSDFNMVLWLGLLTALAVIVGGSFWLRSHEYTRAALGLAWLLAVPALGATVLLVSVLISEPRWN